MKTKLWLLGGVIGLPLLGWLIIFLGMIFSPNPTKPKITYGEFPFKLVYEINGKQKIIEDTLICEFDGFGWNEGSGKNIKWKSRLASGNEKIVIFKISNLDYIYYNPGHEEYYMGEWNSETYKHDFPNARAFLKSTTIKTERGLVLRGIEGILKPEDLIKYNIKLISWDYAQPIANEFS